MSRDVVATICLSSLQHNAKVVKRLAPSASIMAMVKSNGYGHGIEPVAHALQSFVSAFGVATIDEALSIRKQGIVNPILLTQGVGHVTELDIVNEHQLSIVVHHQHQLALLKKNKSKVNCWLKVDTGMSRLGFAMKEFSDALQQTIQFDCHNRPVLMTHLANADDAHHQLTQQQQHHFKQLTQSCSFAKSVCNSAALLQYPAMHYDWVRPGIMLYGISPLLNKVGQDFDLKPVMHLSAKLISIKQVSQGDVIGYGSEYQCQKNMRIGIVNIGYGDGYPRHAVSGTPVLINGIQCPLVGRVSMDMMAVALPTHKQINIGDKVTLWGESLPIERVASCAGTIAYELMNKLTRRVGMKYV